MLSAAQEALCKNFARSGGDKFSGVAWDDSPATASPRLAGALAWLDCSLRESHAAGDHWLVVGQVLDMGSGEGQPLVFYRGGFGTFGRHSSWRSRLGRSPRAGSPPEGSPPEGSGAAPEG